MDNSQAVQYLDSLLGKTLRIHTSDTRQFVGVFKCTDNDRNIILALTHEYRHPSSAAGRETASWDSLEDDKQMQLNMTRRFIGLVVVPGQHITKIELDDVPSRSGIV